MSVQPCAAIKFRELDANGAPLAGGLLFTYAAGTTTPLATYTDSTGNVANANPVVLDAAGRADLWLTPGVLYKFVLQNSSGQTQYTEDNFPPAGSSAAASQVNAVAIDPGGRLTLTNGTPVTTGDVTGATSVYYSPLRSVYVPVFDGTNWALQSIGAGLAQATSDTTKSPAAVVASSIYDLFIWNDAGTIRCTRGPPWTSDTARGAGVGTTELAQQNGRWVNKNGITNGPGPNLGTYVGTVRSDGSSQINDSAAKRHCWNAYNRAERPMLVEEGRSSWNYSTATWRQAHAAAANQLDYVQGLAGDPVNASVITCVTGPTGNTVDAAVSVGVDSTTTPAATALGFSPGVSSGLAFSVLPTMATYRGYPGIGRHFLAWLEWAFDATTSWNNVDATAGVGQSGISGSILG